jgi:hypothetical protein
MSNTLTTSQIASFDLFANNVKSYLDGVSTTTKSKVVRIVEKATFLDLWKIVARPSKLAPVMQTVQFFEQNGRTKSKFRLRNEDGSLRVDEAGEPVFSRTHVVMYKAETYRALRSEITGLATPETIYGIMWKDVPSDMQTKLRQFYFPNAKNSKGETLPSFVPQLLGIVLRKGRKPVKGERRHSWAGFDFVIAGFYGTESTPVVITQVSVANKPYLQNLATFAHIACPDWGQEEGVSEEMSKAACGIYQNLEFSF